MSEDTSYVRRLALAEAHEHEIEHFLRRRLAAQPRQAVRPTRPACLSLEGQVALMIQETARHAPGGLPRPPAAPALAIAACAEIDRIATRTAPILMDRTRLRDWLYIQEHLRTIEQQCHLDSDDREALARAVRNLLAAGGVGNDP